MARINTNIAATTAQFNLREANIDLDTRLQRLATGLRINRGADDPAGLIISERLGTDISGLERALTNGDRASSVIATSEAALREVGDLLNTIQGLLVESANTGANSLEEREANQLQIDSAIQSITRISNTASFGGLRLLDGSLDYITSGVTGTDIADVAVQGAAFIGADNVQVEVDVLASAQRAGLIIAGNQPALSGNVLGEQVTLQIGGSRGITELTFASGSSLADIANAISAQEGLTGVRASLVNGNPNSGLLIESTGFGSSEFVSIERVNLPVPNSAFNTQRLVAGTPLSNPLDLSLAAQFENAVRDTGQDVSALINGSLATGDGLDISINSPTLAVELTLTEAFATTPTLATSTFDIIGGGALFQLGPDITPLQQANIGIQSVAASNLGGVPVGPGGSLQFLSSLMEGQPNSIAASVARNDFTASGDIIAQALDEITVLRGRLGAFERNVLDTNRRSLASAQENLTASRSLIQDADFAFETSALTRAQILQQSTTSVLQLANQNAQSVLSLLG